MKNWKTTANGILAAIIGAAGPLTAYLATINSPKAAIASGIVTLVASIARVWIGYLQNDSSALPGTSEYGLHGEPYDPTKPPVYVANTPTLNK